MKAFVVLSLIGYLVVPSGTAVLGRCVVAKKLHEGGLSNFEGYSLENCEYALSAPSPHLLPFCPLPRHPQLQASLSHTPPVPS